MRLQTKMKKQSVLTMNVHLAYPLAALQSKGSPKLVAEMHFTETHLLYFRKIELLSFK